MTTEPDRIDPGIHLPLTPLDFHLLLVLAEGDLHGYGIMKAVETQSAGRLKPEIGSLYRMIARLMTNGLIAEAPPRGEAKRRDGPGKARRYYRITPTGRAVAGAEAARLRDVLTVAEARDLPLPR